MHPFLGLFCTYKYCVIAMQKHALFLTFSQDLGVFLIIALLLVLSDTLVTLVERKAFQEK